MAYHVDTNGLCASTKRTSHDSAVLAGIHLMDRGKRRQQIESWHQRNERWAASRILAADAAFIDRSLQE